MKGSWGAAPEPGDIQRMISVTKTYRVVLLGKIEGKQDFEEKMEKFGFSSAMVRDLTQKAPSLLKAGLALGEARDYAEAVQDAGGKVNIQEDGFCEEPKNLRSAIEIRSLKDFTMCPECGHRQLKAEVCVRCGFLLFQDKEKRSAR